MLNTWKIGKIINNIEPCNKYFNAKNEFDKLAEDVAVHERLLASAIQDSAAHMIGQISATGAYYKLSAAVTTLNSLQSTIRTKRGNARAYAEGLKKKQLSNQAVGIVRDVDSALEYLKDRFEQFTLDHAIWSQSLTQCETMKVVRREEGELSMRVFNEMQAIGSAGTGATAELQVLENTISMLSQSQNDVPMEGLTRSTTFQLLTIEQILSTMS